MHHDYMINVDIPMLILFLRREGYGPRRIERDIDVCRNRVYRLTNSEPHRVTYNEAQALWNYSVDVLSDEQLDRCLK